MIWEKTCERYVAYIDLSGFKDMLQKSTASNNLKKLKVLENAVENLDNTYWSDIQKEKIELNIEPDQTKSLTFSDSIILFSKGSSIEDFFKIVNDACFIRKNAIKNNIPVRIIISYGNITIDFDKSLFIGQPINDAYLLLEDLFLLSIVLDHNAEKKVKSYKENKIIKTILHFRKAKMEFGAVTHTIINSAKKEIIDEDILILKKLYNVTSAAQKFCIDNTIDFYQN